MPPKKTPSSLESNLMPINQMWFDEYTKERIISSPVSRRIESALKSPAIVCKPFNTITIHDIKTYVDTCKNYGYKSNTIATNISHLSTFAEFLKTKYPDTFERTFFLGVADVSPQRETEQPAQALSYTQLCAIRRYIQTEPIVLYFFELVFQTPVKKEDIKYCTPKNSDSATLRFSHKGHVICNYNDRIQDIIDQYEKDVDLSISTYDIANCLRKITEYLQGISLYSRKREITFQDISETQKKFFFTCPNCGRKLENHISNWILARTEYDKDSDYHLFCKYCKGGVRFED